MGRTRGIVAGELLMLMSPFLLIAAIFILLALVQ
jgi:hypothetical protein